LPRLLAGCPGGCPASRIPKAKKMPMREHRLP